MLFARYCKARPNALWFKLHVPFQVTGLVIALIAIVLIFVAVRALSVDTAPLRLSHVD